MEVYKGTKIGESHIVLMSDTSQQSDPLVFKRLFMGFNGLKKGSMEGCKKVLCIDAYFIKTLLGGQLLTTMWGDGNNQMFP